ncbi:MAG: GNAT family N-acetyltransferase [Anaerolineae bacterium]|nr:GNAT family N-acetyltransferase [Anaerolineae bacterium]
MKDSFGLVSSEFDIALRTITENDLENLRVWKNAHRFAFFYQEIITPEQQIQWFQGYQARANDYMFIVHRAEQTIGCMGFRLLDQYADIYNVIRADPNHPGAMGNAMRLLCSFIATGFTRDIRARVLVNNPARRWYQHNGFIELIYHDTFVEVQLDWSRFQPCPFEKIQSRRQP